MRMMCNLSELCLIVRTHGKHILINCKEVGRKPPTFNDASIIATELLDSGYEFDQGSMIYNRFRWAFCSAPSVHKWVGHISQSSSDSPQVQNSTAQD